jgi:hypothetical protein
MAIIQWISTLTSKIMRAWAGRYRPERHYMRGRGPASKRSQSQGAGSWVESPDKKGSGKPEPLASTHLRQNGLA